MAIEWITIVAQIVNFLILVWLLQRFLYGPIVRAMTEREETIRNQLENAARAREEAEAEAHRLRETRQAIEARRQDLLAEAKADADAVRQHLEKEMRAEIDKRAESWRGQVDEERFAFIADLRKRSAEHFYEMARTAFAGLANQSQNQAMAETFLSRLSGLSENDRAKLKDEALTAGGLRIESSFDLTGKTRRQIERALHESFGAETPLQFTTADDLICGIRLRAGGQTLGWSLAGYLDRLESHVRSEFDGARAVNREAAE